MDVDDEIISEQGGPHTIQARLVSDAGEEAGPPIDLPVGVTTEQLELILNALLKNVSITLNLMYLFPLTSLNYSFIRKNEPHIYSLSTKRKLNKV
jgi:hypothetical protein